MSNDALAGGTPAATPSTPAATPTPSTPAAAPSATPSTPSSPAAPAAAPSTPTPAAAPPAADGVAELRELAAVLGKPGDLKATLDFLRGFKADVERANLARRDNDPDYQASQRRGATFRALVEEGYSPAHADAIARLPELFADRDALEAERNQERAIQARSIMVDELREIGIEFPDTEEGRKLLDAWDDRFGDRLNTSEALNKLYFNPKTMRQAIKQMVADEEARLNPILLSHGSRTLREHAARRASIPTAGRAATPTLPVSEEMPKAPITDAAGRRREHKAIASKQIDQILAHYGMH